jgi:hypothetical protein
MKSSLSLDIDPVDWWKVSIRRCDEHMINLTNNNVSDVDKFRLEIYDTDGTTYLALRVIDKPR